VGFSGRLFEAIRGFKATTAFLQRVVDELHHKRLFASTLPLSKPGIFVKFATRREDGDLGAARPWPRC
jgi:hypothetical protein